MSTATPDIPAVDTEFEVRVSDDKLQVLLDCADPLANLDANIVRIIAAFGELELPEYPDAAFLKEQLGRICKPGVDAVDLPLIRGYAARPPVDARLEWSRDYFADGFEIDEQTGAVDFWARIDNLAVENGEVLVRIHPPAEGEPGLTVYGNKIPVGKPQKVRLRCGKGVAEQTEPDGTKVLTATTAGRLRQADGTLAVDDVYMIRGDLDLEVGNIRHTGTLVVGGDVALGASLEVGGDIIVKGMMEGCNVNCGGDLVVTGGIVGADGYAIEVGGSVRARYIREAQVTAVGHVQVAGELSHSTLLTRGRLDVQRGRIIGGTTVARLGIKTGQAGASGVGDTLLVAGLDPLAAEDVEAARMQLEKLERKMERLEHAAPEDDAARAERAERSARLAAAIAAGEKKLARTLAENAGGAREEIVILTGVHSGTTLQLGAYRMTVHAGIERPRLVSRKGTKVRVLPLGDDNMPTD